MFRPSLGSAGYEKNFIRQAIFSSHIRLDGRGLNDMRPLYIKLDRGERSCTSEVSIGATSIVCVVTGHMVAPYPDKPNEGSLHFNTEISPHTETLGITHAEVSRLLERTIRDSESIDTESLCIVTGELVWEIRCELRVIDGIGGNVIDACVLAAMAALKGFRKPEVSVVSTEFDDNNKSKSKLYIHHSDEREPLPLALQHVPLQISLGILMKSHQQQSLSSTNKEALSNDEKYIFLVDPSSEEESALDGRISFSLNAHQELCAVSKPGGISLPAEMIMKSAAICAKKVEWLHKQFAIALQQLEEQTLSEREVRLEKMRKFRALEEAHALSSRMESDEGNDENNTSNEETFVGGIDRNDPILQWSYLHEPVRIRET